LGRSGSRRLCRIAVYTWDKLHTAIIGADNKVLDLRAKARAIEASIRAKL
jgi:hypothetical protein